MNNHFMPDPVHPTMRPYASARENYELIKAAFRTDLMANEACMNKCNLNLASDDLEGAERECLHQCAVKYNDCALLVDYEMTHFVRGTPL